MVLGWDVPPAAAPHPSTTLRKLPAALFTSSSTFQNDDPDFYDSAKINITRPSSWKPEGRWVLGFFFIFTPKEFPFLTLPCSWPSQEAAYLQPAATKIWFSWNFPPFPSAHPRTMGFLGCLQSVIWPSQPAHAEAPLLPSHHLRGTWACATSPSPLAGATTTPQTPGTGGNPASLGGGRGGGEKKKKVLKLSISKDTTPKPEGPRSHCCGFPLPESRAAIFAKNVGCGALLFLGRKGGCCSRGGSWGGHPGLKAAD